MRIGCPDPCCIAQAADNFTIIGAAPAMQKPGHIRSHSIHLATKTSARRTLWVRRADGETSRPGRRETSPGRRPAARPARRRDAGCGERCAVAAGGAAPPAACRVTSVHARHARIGSARASRQGDAIRQAAGGGTDAAPSGAQSACLRRKAGISYVSTPFSCSAATWADADSRELRHTAGVSRLL